MLPAEESQLINQAQRGDKEALTLLLQRHYTFLLRYLMKITLNPALAEDLTQETMLRCVEKIRLYNGHSKFSSWLITIASRLYIDYTRKSKREKRYLELEKGLIKLKWYTGLAGADWSDAIEALGTLQEDIRLPIVLKHYYGYSYDEIGAMMNIPSGTVKSRIHNGLRSLRKELKLDEETR